MDGLPANATRFYADAEALAERIPDGALLALPPDYSLPAMAVVRALVRRPARNLRLLGVPVLGMCADLLIGAGCVAEIETSAVSLGEAGLAPRFTEAVERGEITVRDATCPMIHAALQAAEKGVPFMPLRGVLGSDLVAGRTDWKVIDNPMGRDDPILLAPAISPDVALFHARWADRAGNVWLGRRRELMTIAHAAKATLVSCEALREGDMLEDELLAPGVLASVYVSAVAEAPRGAWPLGVAGAYPVDDAHLAAYARAAKTREGFARYLDEWVLTPRKSFSPA
ncbi:MAG TPA: CoA-transferase [Burkholderiales bacterium]|nr:CoA-transferase [Burkholderiales bacterium]